MFDESMELEGLTECQEIDENNEIADATENAEKTRRRWARLGVTSIVLGVLIFTAVLIMRGCEPEEIANTMSTEPTEETIIEETAASTTTSPTETSEITEDTESTEVVVTEPDVVATEITEPEITEPVTEPVETTEPKATEPEEPIPESSETAESTKPTESTETVETEPTEPVSEPSEAPESDETEPDVYSEDVEMLACVIYQEVGGDYYCDDCRRRVADVVLNRVADSRFPDTIYGVLTQSGQYGRFAWTGVVWPERAGYSGEAHAVERAYRIAEEVLNGQHSELYGNGYVWQAGFVQGSDNVYCCGHYFGR